MTIFDRLELVVVI